MYDNDRQVCVLFGGSNANDTWQWDGQSWTILETPNAPPARDLHAMCYDARRHAVVMFGGRNVDGDLLDDTWELVCTPPCAPDLDGSGQLDLFDFLTFVNFFNAQDPGADCDSNQVFDLFDFLCFTNVFNAGC